MEIIGIILFFIILLIFIIPYKYLTYKRDSFLKIEKNNKIIYTEICGANFDSLGILDVFHTHVLTTRLAIYEKYIVISYRKKIILGYNDIIKLEISGTIPQSPHTVISDWKKLSVTHKDNRFSKKIDLYLLNCNKVKNIIEEYLN